MGAEDTLDLDLHFDEFDKSVLKGVVLAGGLDGKPVARAFVQGETNQAGVSGMGIFEGDANEMGRFEIKRLRVDAYVYARNPEGTLATIVNVGAAEEKATILLSDAGKIKGCLLDQSGKPMADVPVECNLRIGPQNKVNAQASLLFKTDEAGRFTILGVVPGAECSLWVSKGKTHRKIKTVPATKLETLDLGDLVCEPKD